MINIRKAFLSLGLVALFSLSACAKSTEIAKREASPSDIAYEASMAKMHKGMMLDYSGDADVDFAKGMIPHHQGAIEMAKIELQYGNDPKLRKLAKQIIKAQEKEIDFLQAWLKKHAK